MNGLSIACILVGVDGSPQSMAACQLAVGLARCYEARLIALHVAVPIAPGLTVSAPEHIRAEEAARTRGEEVLDAARALAAGVIQFAADLEFGDPAAVIDRRAQELEADLVVVGSRGLGRLDRLLLGSVSSALVQRAPCSVLVVR